MAIRVLPPDIAAKIAAGEVVERPASVVKELVENAIDAKASVIRVEIQKGGKRLIRVMDNGQGIAEEDIPLVFARHATSKLASIEDLNQIRSLGFRGEALASVSAVSRLTLTSRPVAQTAAIRIQIEGGEQQGLNAAGSPAGTIITVNDLFYNVPARKKFLKADATEAGHIHRIVSHYALAYPDIRFSLQNENRTIFQTSGSGELFDALVSVFSLETARQMIAVTNDDETTDSSPEIVVHGYTGTPSLHRGLRDQLIFFVNQRWIQDRSLNQAVIQAYHTFLPVQRYPVAVINVEIDPVEVDVNVHPTKAEVKFREPRGVFRAVQKTVREAVLAAAPVPSYGTSPEPSQSWHSHDEGENRRSRMDLNQLGFEAQRTLSLEDRESDDSDSLAFFDEETKTMPLMRVIGQVQQMYIIAEGPEGMYLIDQHAAHERVLYEKLSQQKARSSVARQQLLEPDVVELSPGQAAILEAEMEALTEVGFELEPFGGTTYRIRALPEMLGQAEPTQALIDVLAEMSDGATPLARETHEKIAIIVCKRASIKGGQTLSMAEMRELIRQLEASSAPRTCPHGRPTMIHLSAQQLAKQFGRL